MEQTDISRLGDVIYQEMNAPVAGFSNIEEFWDKLTTLMSVWRRYIPSSVQASAARATTKTLSKRFKMNLRTDK